MLISKSFHKKGDIPHFGLPEVSKDDTSNEEDKPVYSPESVVVSVRKMFPAMRRRV